MAPAETVDLRKCRTSGCGCTVKADDVYCSEHCENQARSAILAGYGCECGHAECRHSKPPAVDPDTQPDNRSSERGLS